MAQRICVTGGAGFIGCNLASSFLSNGYQVTVVDSLTRRGSEQNVRWLRSQAGGALRFIQADVRDFEAVRSAVRDADVIFHLAAQVAVTTSVDDPRTDFEVNALGTFNVLEAVRQTGCKRPVVFTSTNKVYGGLDDVGVEELETRYVLRDHPAGIAESQPLDFHSPYGCSKGAADQYVRDYARIYGMRTIVFRMSCIYGPRQFGNEDQGWLAHFMIAALKGRPITIYGNGKQVRDVLFVDDLVRAFRLAVEHVDHSAGQIFNIGGGPQNALAVWTEFGEALAGLRGQALPVAFDNWRPGDQPCYISDIRKAQSVIGWKPQVGKQEGIRRLWDWVAANEGTLDAALGSTAAHA